MFVFGFVHLLHNKHVNPLLTDAETQIQVTPAANERLLSHFTFYFYRGNMSCAFLCCSIRGAMKYIYFNFKHSLT